MSVQLQRNSSLDLVRLIAFIFLITCHTCDPFNAAATYGVGGPHGFSRSMPARGNECPRRPDWSEFFQQETR